MEVTWQYTCPLDYFSLGVEGSYLRTKYFCQYLMLCFTLVTMHDTSICICTIIICTIISCKFGNAEALYAYCSLIDTPCLPAIKLLLPCYVLFIQNFLQPVWTTG